VRVLDTIRYDTMGKKRAGERETEEQEKAAAGTPDAKKRRSGSPTTDAAAVLCDDVVGNILARVPARTAVASMALSRRHRRLIRSPEFRSLHCRLAPPLPRPHIAYLVTATVRMRPAGKDEVPASAFQGFHVAGNDPMPMRALAGPRFSDVGYVNTCNGIVLLAGDKYSAQSRCILWNPAVADVVAEVSVPGADADASTHVKEYRAPEE